MAKIYLLIILAFGVEICRSQENFIPFNQPELSYEGRVWHVEDAAVLAWPGTSVTIHFTGTSVKAVMKDLDTANYYNVIIDGNVISKIHTDTIKRTYTFAFGLPCGEHTLQLFKRTEWDKGKTLFYGFELPEEGKILPAPAPKKRKIEFFGNSITCGYGNEDSTGKDSWHGYFQNNYATYAAITARHFNAQYHCTSKSGIGIMVSWFPLIMPQMYSRLDPTDSASRWDFIQYTPDVVVVNLFQNDSWLVHKPTHPEFKRAFGTNAPDSTAIVNAYKQFVSTLRKTYPQASIICALGSMDATRLGSPWPGYVKKAVAQMHDPKIYTCFFPYKNTGGHPIVSEQRAMANQLIEFIETNIEW